MKKYLCFLLSALFCSACNHQSEQTSEKNIPAQKSVEDTLAHSPKQVLADISNSTNQTDIFPVFQTQKINYKPVFLSVEKQAFIINSNRDTTIFGEERTRIFIPANVFVTESGKTVNDNVSITLKECYHPKEMIKEKLSTHCNQRLLETEGMIYLEAIANNEKLKLKEGKSIIVHFPKENPNQKADIFYGQVDTSGVVGWEQADSLLREKFNFLVNYHNYTATKYSIRAPVGRDFLCGFMDTLTGNQTFKRLDLETIVRNYNMFNDSGVHLDIDFDTYNQPKVHIQNAPSLDFEEKLTEMLLQQIKICDNVDYNWRSKYLKEKEYIKLRNGYTNNWISNNIYPIELYVWKITKPAYQDNRAYKDAFQTKYYNTTIKDIDEAELNFYIFNTNQLGWINCDRFLNLEGDIVDYTVETDEHFEGQVSLVFSNRKSVLMGGKSKKGFIFKGVPVNEPVKIVAISKQNEQTLCAIQTATIETKPYQGLTFSNMTMSQLDAALEEITQ